MYSFISSNILPFTETYIIFLLDCGALVNAFLSSISIFEKYNQATDGSAILCTLHVAPNETHSSHFISIFLLLEISIKYNF